MRWEDERYVRLYTRNTGTWIAIGWEGRFVLMSLLRQVDRAGCLDVEAGEESMVVAAMIMAPLEVVEIGLKRLLEREVLKIADGQLRWPKFLEAQECRTSDKERQRKSRELAALGHTPSHAVTDGHTPSQLVTPSRAVPSRTQTSLKDLAGKKPPAKVEAFVLESEVEKPPSEHQALIDSLVGIFETVRGAKYGFDGRDAKSIKHLLRLGLRSEVETRWARALGLTHPTVDNIWQLPKAWNRCATDAPRPGAVDPNGGIITRPTGYTRSRPTPSPEILPEMEVPFD